MSRAFSEDINNPELFEENKAGDYCYKTNGAGGKTAAGSLKFADSPERDGKAQSAAGHEMRRGADHPWGKDDGGHLIGARFNGGKGEENLTAQNQNLNRGSYKRLENEWAAHLENGEKVFVNIETDNGERPNAYMGYAIYEAQDGTRSSEMVSFVNESRSEQEKWEQDLTTVELEPGYFDGWDDSEAQSYVSIDNGEEEGNGKEEGSGMEEGSEEESSGMEENSGMEEG